MARPAGHRPASHEPRTTSGSIGEVRPPLDEDHAPSVFLATDLLTAIGRDGCFKRLAPKFPRAFGYANAELLNQPFLSFIHLADRAATSEAPEQLAQGEPTLGLENRFRCRDASYRRLAWTAGADARGAC